MSPTLLFSSFHNYLDQGSGAAISAREVLRELARRGWRVRVLCGSLFDDATADESSFYATLKRRNITPTVERKRVAPDDYQLNTRNCIDVAHTVAQIAGVSFQTSYTELVYTPDDLCEELLDPNKQNNGKQGAYTIGSSLEYDE